LPLAVYAAAVSYRHGDEHANNNASSNAAGHVGSQVRETPACWFLTATTSRARAMGSNSQWQKQLQAENT